MPYRMRSFRSAALWIKRPVEGRRAALNLLIASWARRRLRDLPFSGFLAASSKEKAVSVLVMLILGVCERPKPGMRAKEASPLLV